MKIFSVLIVASALLALAGCGKEDDGAASAIDKAKNAPSAASTSPENRSVEAHMQRQAEAAQAATKAGKIFPPP